MPHSVVVTLILLHSKVQNDLDIFRREARGENTAGLAAKTHGRINSAGCEGMPNNSYSCSPFHLQAPV
jgi:hypothetical protein